MGSLSTSWAISTGRASCSGTTTCSSFVVGGVPGDGAAAREATAELDVRSPQAGPDDIRVEQRGEGERVVQGAPVPASRAGPGRAASQVTHGRTVRLR